MEESDEENHAKCDAAGGPAVRSVAGCDQYAEPMINTKEFWTMLSFGSLLREHL